MAQSLQVRDIVKGAAVFVRFKMKHKDGTAAPSAVYAGWITNVTVEDMVWVNFGFDRKTIVFEMHVMIEDIQNFFKIGQEEEEDEEDVEILESHCVDALLQFNLEL